MTGADMVEGDSAEAGEIRRNPVSGKLTIVAPGRATRPRDAAAAGPEGADGAAACPFCGGNEHLTPPEVDALRPAGGEPDSAGWRARVVPNKYPALAGRHEVLIHSPHHEVELEDLAEDDLAEVLGLWQRRITRHFEGGAAAAIVLVNRGPGSGASLEHPHEQLLATPVVPPAVLDELLEFERHRNRYGGCVLCGQIERAGSRLVLDGDVAAWVPHASRFAGELWLAPAEHGPDFRRAGTLPVARALRRVLTATTATIGEAPLNLWLHTAPADLRGPYHWHIEIAPRRSHLAGFELGTDITIVSADPAREAARLREALPD